MSLGDSIGVIECLYLSNHIWSIKIPVLCECVGCVLDGWRTEGVRQLRLIIEMGYSSLSLFVGVIQSSFNLADTYRDLGHHAEEVEGLKKERAYRIIAGASLSKIIIAHKARESESDNCEQIYSFFDKKLSLSQCRHK